MITFVHQGVVLAATVGLAWTALASGATASATPGPSACGNDALTVTRSFVDSGAGHSGFILIYRNHTARTCTVYGYPGLDAVDRHGHVLAHAVRTRGTTALPRTVSIAPSRYASASVEWQNFDGRTGGPCATPAAVETIVANTTRAHRLPVSVTACGLQVHPTLPNTPMYPHYGRAQHSWIAGSTVDAAHMDSYLLAAADTLQSTGLYPTEVAQLRQLAALPLTGLTRKQLAEAHADVAALDDFFATPGLYR